MTPGLEAHLRGMGESKRIAMATSSRVALRQAWPNRHTHPLRAGTVIRSNVTMLRNLAAIS